MSPEEVDAFKMADLKAKCKELGLPGTGVKADLVARIKAHFAGTGDGDAQAEGAAPPAADEIVEEEAAEVDEDAVIEEAIEETAQPVRTAPTGKYQPIVFSEDIARKMEAQKIEVAHVAAPAAIQPSAEDKLKARAERFVDPAVAKLKERAQRFNLSHPEVEKDKLLQRALKFGSLHPVVEEEKRKKRAERFNIVSEEQKKKMRADKFKPLSGAQPAAAAKGISTATAQGDTDAANKLAARAIRFAPQ